MTQINYNIKFQIFISSPFSEKIFRDLAYATISSQGHFPMAMERQPSSTLSTESAIKQAILESQIIIFILGWKYGEENPRDPESKSFTEQEYDFARNNNKSILVFMQHRNEIEQNRAILSRNDEDYNNSEKLNKFYDKIIQDDKLNSRWSMNDTDAFVRNVSAAIATATRELERTCPEKGWFNAQSADLLQLLSPSIKNELRREIVAKANIFKRLDERCTQSVGEKKAISRTFCNYFSDYFGLNTRKFLFIESGSTTAFVAQALGERLGEKIKQISISDSYRPEMHIVTNNYLAYLHLWLRNGVPCEMFPGGPAQEPYGAVYGPLSQYGHNFEPSTSYCRQSIRQEDQAKIGSLNTQFTQLLDNKKVEANQLLMVGAISGIQISDRYNISKIENDSVIEEQIKKLKGFHVGNYFNMLFKRFMYKTKCPIVICIHAEKIDAPIEKGKCHFIFDNEYTWENFYKNYPLAFCIGYKAGDGKLERIIESMSFISFTRDTQYSENGEYQAALFTNNEFTNCVKIK
ncbi:MAG: DUF4062 domain-containing protein [Magnetococcales bacterium]|nr:DUF4062 domain-containing protein [Magnetococcales bacterium]